MKQISMMIVHDQNLIRECWNVLLTGHDRFDVVADAADDTSAINYAMTKQPEIILFYLKAPCSSTLKVLKVIHRVSLLSRIIIVSSNSEPSFIKKLFRLGAKGCITKNSSWDELVSALIEVGNGNIFICQEIKNILADATTGEAAKNTTINSLSSRELHIGKLLSLGMTSRQIAFELNISQKTVDVHRYNILRKMNMKNTASLVNLISSRPDEY
jgi:DNA-binding NarL/FixJ family response regulator